MAIAGFEQDQSAMPGMGWVSDEFGNKRYLFAPDVAQQFGGGQVMQPPQAMQPQPMDDQRVAMGPMASAQAGQMQPQDMAGGARQGPAPSAADVTASTAPVPNAATAANNATGQGQPANLSEAIANKAMTDVGQAMAREQNQPARKVGEKYIPKSKELATTQQGRPVEEGELERTAAPFIERGTARYQQGELEAQQGYGKAVEAFGALPQQYAAAAAAQKKRDEIDARVNQTMDEVNTNMQEAAQADKNFNPNRLFSGTAGTAAGIGAAIFRAMGAYAQIKGRQGNNAAGEIIDAAIDRDIMQQKAQIASSKGNVDNALKRLTLYRGDQQHAEDELKAYQTSYAVGRMNAYAAATNLPQVQVNMQKDIADIQAQADKAVGAVKDRAYGLHAEKVESKYVPAHTEGGPLTVDQALARAGKTANVLETFSKAGAEKTKGDALIVPDGRGGQIRALDDKAAGELRESYGSMVGGVKIAGQMADMAKDTSILNAARGLVPWTTEMERNWNTKREALMHAYNNALVGKSTVVREASMERFAHDLAGKPWSPGAQSALKEIQTQLQDHYQEQLAGHLSPEELRRRAAGGGQGPVVEEAP